MSSTPSSPVRRRPHWGRVPADLVTGVLGAVILALSMSSNLSALPTPITSSVNGPAPPR